MKYIEYLGETERLSREILTECFRVSPPVFSYAKFEKLLFGKERLGKTVRYDMDNLIRFVYPRFYSVSTSGRIVDRDLIYRVVSKHGSIDFIFPGRTVWDRIEIITDSQVLLPENVTPEIDLLCEQLLNIHEAREEYLKRSKEGVSEADVVEHLIKQIGENVNLNQNCSVIGYLANYAISIRESERKEKQK